MIGDLNRYIDHTLLRPEATAFDIEKLCQEAKEYEFICVIVNPCWLELGSGLLKDSGIKLGSVSGFPLGASTIETKLQEAGQAIATGAEEIDMVMNIGKFKQGETGFVLHELQEMRRVCQGKTLKVIIETALLIQDEKIRAAKLVQEAGADFVKTSTGLGLGGATVEDVALLRKTVGQDFGVKASGGIRTYATCQSLIEAGADRIGTSASVAIMQEYLKAPQVR